jgi:hypothetical protein
MKVPVTSLMKDPVTSLMKDPVLSQLRKSKWCRDYSGKIYLYRAYNSRWTTKRWAMSSVRYFTQCLFLKVVVEFALCNKAYRLQNCTIL